MKIPLSPLSYLFSVSVVYLIVGLINVFVYKFMPGEYIQFVYLVILAMPLFIPMRKVVDMNPIWRML